MGLFDKFRKKEKATVINEPQGIETKNNMPKFTGTPDGRLNAEYYNGETGEFYDTTKLTIDVNKPFIMGGQQLYNCVVAWDGTHDCIILSDDGRDNTQVAGNRYDYKGVWLELDLTKLQTDPNYCNVLMNDLLLRSRVNKYIEDGLKETPERPCGKYIGGVREQNGGYTKYFDAMVGKIAHNAPLMLDRRAKLREKEAQAKAARIEHNKQKIAELQKENEELGM